MKMDNMIQMGMRDEEIIEIMIEKRVNARFEKEKAELLSKVAEMINERESAKSSSYDDGFHKVSHYLQMLIEVAGKTEHKVHAEIDEAMKKLKELAYK